MNVGGEHLKGMHLAAVARRWQTESTELRLRGFFRTFRAFQVERPRLSADEDNLEQTSD
jgi:hypothetical protein